MTEESPILKGMYSDHNKYFPYPDKTETTTKEVSTTENIETAEVAVDANADEVATA